MPLTGSYPSTQILFATPVSSANNPQRATAGPGFDDLSCSDRGRPRALGGLTNPDGTLKTALSGSTFSAWAEPRSDPFGCQDQLRRTSMRLRLQRCGARLGTATTGQRVSAAGCRWPRRDATTGASSLIGGGLRCCGYGERDRCCRRKCGGQQARHSTAAMSQALAYKDLAFQWAEYLAGPVAPAPPRPKAVGDGQWSAKWWAVRARRLLGGSATSV